MQGPATVAISEMEEPMRKTIAILFGAVLALAFAGCAGGQDPSGSPAGAAASGSSALQSSQVASVSAEDAGDSDSGSADGASTASTATMRVNGTSFKVALADTEAASTLAELLEGGPMTVELHSYGGFEKVGPLPQALPESDEQITTVSGDVMLYQGDQITVFYGSNTWDYTPLGRIEGATADGLLAAFGDGDVTVELSL